VEWARAVGEQSVEEGADALALTSDGGYIVAGYTDDDVYVLKFAGNGNWEWARTVNGGSGIDYAVSVQQTADGGYIVAGSTYSFSADDSDIMLLKFEEDAGVMSLAWTRIIQYEGDTEEDAYAVIQNSDNDYVIAGSLGITSTLLLEVTEGGAIPWAVSAYGDGIKGFSSVAQTSDGGYIAAGNPSSSGIGDFDALLFKYSDTGTLSWAKTIGGDQKDIARAVAQSSDGGYAIAGSTSSFGSGIFSVLLAKTDPNGDILDCEVCTTVSPTTSSLTLSLTSPTLTPGAPTPTITTPVVSSVSIALEMDFVCGLHEKLYLPVVLNE
jgi:hypothetical protein